MKKYFSSYWIRSAFYTFLQRFSLTFFGFANFVILFRNMHDTAQVGTWALFLTVTAIFESTKTGLLKNAHILYVTGSDDKHERAAVASSSFVINSMITLLFVLFIIFFSPWLSQVLHAGNDLAQTLIWFIPGLVFMVFFSHLEAIQQSHLDFKGVFAGYLVRQALFFVVIALHPLLGIPFSLPRLALFQSLSILAGTATIYVYSRPYIMHRFNVSVKWIKRILNYGGYIFGSGLVSNIFASVDQLMIAKFSLSSSVAYYNAASRINSLVDIPSYAASDILFPKASRASVEEGVGKLKYLYERMVSILLSFTIPGAILVAMFPKLVITIVAGSRYEIAAPILQLYMLTGILRPMQNQAANLLNSMGKSSLCFVINTVSLIANLCINYFCLSHFGFYGAAIGTLITCTLGAIAWYFVMRKQIGLELGNVVRYIVDLYKSAYGRGMKMAGRAPSKTTTDEQVTADSL